MGFWGLAGWAIDVSQNPLEVSGRSLAKGDILSISSNGSG